MTDNEIVCLKRKRLFQNIGGPLAENGNSPTVREETYSVESKALVAMEGVALKTEEKLTKDRNMMASVRIGTSMGETYAMFFPREYEKYAGLLKQDTEVRLYGEYIQDKYGKTYSVKEAYPVSDDVYYISMHQYEESILYPYRRRCGCQLYLMELSGRLVNTGFFYSFKINSIKGVRKIPKI